MQLLQKSTDASSPAACATEILDGIFPVVQFIRHAAQRRKTPGLAIQQFRALAYIRRFPGHSLSRVAEYLGLSLPAASRLVEALVARGLVQRQPIPGNRRQVQINISPAGAKLLESAIQMTLEELEVRLRKLSAARRRRIIGAVGDLRRLFEPALDD